jgi:hypothetical protein
VTVPIPGIKGPLVFGNMEQIVAIKKAEAQAEFKALPECEKCDGKRECWHCDAECSDCEGTGKNWQAYQAWKEKHPGTWPKFG